MPGSPLFEILPRFEPIDSGRVTFMNPYSWLVSRDRGHPDLPEFRIFADGILLVWLYNVFFGGRIARFAFDYSSVASEVFDRARAQGKRVYLIGGEPGVAASAAKVIEARHPGLQICGTRSGFFDGPAAREQGLAEAADADIVVAGMGVPHQEAFIADLWRRGWRGAGYTCGGFLEQIVGTDGTYFPDWSNRFHLRWAWRIWREPRRLGWRYAVDYPRFLAAFLADWLRGPPARA